MLLKNPKAGAVIPGTGGLRKLRIPVNDSGKRGGGRVIYVDIEKKETIYLLQVYMKNEKEDLTIKERKLLRNMISILKEE
ncbi:MAG: type II toxin-antitoxin system RelE/ParE family toxin [Lachnospiraceae bacterium]|nr:type II toxin-antitoxin system RelE/ParE family toxin [Lachnospiraceae bacterium]MCD7840957.1 type II toxin-antitoxin system RelE/ParE family toxin [Lachnospiraceae bacterium]